MALTKPALPPVSPGQPVTAQAWNAILSAIDVLFDGVNAFGTNAVTITLTAGGGIVTSAVVVAVPASGHPVVAVPPFGSGTTFQLTNLTPGAWTVHAAAPGFNNAQQAITVPVTGPVTIPLTSNGSVTMPQLFGLNAVQALSSLNAQSIAIQQILDVDGTVISATSLPTDHTGSRVLAQFPPPGTRVTPASAGTQILLSSGTTKTTKEGFEKPPIEKLPQTEIFNAGVIGLSKTPVLETLAGGSPGGGTRAAAREGLVAGTAGPPGEAAPAGEARVFITPDERPPLGRPFVEAPLGE